MYTDVKNLVGPRPVELFDDGDDDNVLNLQASGLSNLNNIFY